MKDMTDEDFTKLRELVLDYGETIIIQMTRYIQQAEDEAEAAEIAASAEDE